jgi:membrane-associated phospholipid phosphatase
MMHEVKDRLKLSGAFFTGYLLFLIPGILLLLIKGKEGSFLALNFYHNQQLDYFFALYTNLGDGVCAVLLSLFLFFALKKKKAGLTVLFAFALTGIITQIIKPLVESPRPETYFSPRWLPFFIRDIIHTGNSSFPSGHTATAFAVASVLALYSKNISLHIALLLLAVAVGFSRIYLSQHFLQDVLAGSFIGVLGGMLCVYWCRNINEAKLGFKKK